jgi:hypothetical protein
MMGREIFQSNRMLEKFVSVSLLFRLSRLFG